MDNSDIVHDPINQGANFSSVCLKKKRKKFNQVNKKMI